MEFQIRALGRSSRRDSIRILIVDNSSNSEAEALRSILSDYGFDGQSDVIENSACRLISSDAHAEGLNIALSNADGEKWILTQDPDFFWLVPDHIAFLESLLVPDMVAIGTPYRRRVGFGQPDFPAAWGSAYAIEHLAPGDFSVARDPVGERFNQPKYEFSQDVGWKIRDRLSDQEYLAFDQRPAFELSEIFGTHSFEASPVEYLHNGNPIALHLFRGSFPVSIAEMTTLASVGTPPKSANEKWNRIKLRFAKTAEVISQSQTCYLLYKIFCQISWFRPRLAHIRAYTPYNYTQRLCLPYGGQRFFVKLLRRRLGKENAGVVLKQIGILSLTLEASRSSFELIYGDGNSDNIAAKLIRLYREKHQREVKDAELGRMVSRVVSAGSASPSDFTRWLAALQSETSTIQQHRNFDDFVFEVAEIAQLLRLILDLRHV